MKFAVALVLLVLVMANARKPTIPQGLWAGLLLLTRGQHRGGHLLVARPRLPEPPVLGGCPPPGRRVGDEMSIPFPLPGFESAPPAEEPRSTRRGPSRDELLAGLNEPQAAAVMHAGAPLLVVAGAGSGKTRVLTRRIAWLISERKAHPGSILAITFTNKAAAEMKERVEDLVGKRARIMWVSTFHSACVRILRKEITALNTGGLGFKSNFSIYDAADSKRLMTLVLKDLELDPKRHQPGAVLHWVSNHKNELRDPEEATKDARNGFEEAYAAAYTAYQRRLREANALDFDDLIMMTVHLFQSFPDVRQNYRRRFRHVLVDEYQDTNHAQYALIHQLCGHDLERGDGPGDEPSELMVVGDADQSIYAFRGANIRNIMDFEQDFPDAVSILLEQNYRSTQTILTAANSVISNNAEPQGQAAVVRGGRRRADRGLRRRRRARRGPLRQRGDRPARRRRAQALRRGGLLPHQRPVAGLRGGVHPHRPALQGRRRGALLRAPRGPRRARLPAACWSTPPTRSPCAGSSTPPSAASGSAPRRACRPWPSASGSPSGTRWSAPTRRPASPPAA